jgi:predicted membrane channel-forming protein YqfA (hemolysin III family)
MKHPMKSKTIRTAITMMTASLTTLCLYYSDAVQLDSTALGAAWSTTISSILMIWLRYMTTDGIDSSPKKVEKEQEDPK